MSFSYYTVYRTEQEEFPSRWLSGAAPLPDSIGQDAWVFWAGQPDDVHPPSRVFIFAERAEGPDGTVIGKLATTGEFVRFVPLTVDWIQQNPEAYPSLASVNLESLTPGDLHLLFHASEISEAYESWLGPLSELVTAEDVDYLGEEAVTDLLIEHSFLEARGVPAEVGAVHHWNDGYDYQKQDDGSWKRVNTSWTPEHPDVPKSTKGQFWDKNWGWDPHRKKLHKELLDEVRAATFGNAKPVPPDETPSFTYIMGPPAAGKSTRAASSTYDNTVKLDPDEFVERLPEFKKAVEVKARNGAQSVVDEALMLNDALLSEAMDGRYNFIVAGTGANLQWMEKEFFPDLKARGYRINVFMTYVDDLDELMLRTEARGHRSGRFIPPERTKHLHGALPKNFKELMSNADVNSLVLLNSHQQTDNSTKNEVAYIQQGEQRIVQQQEFFDSVMEKAK